MLTVKEAASKLGVSPARVRKLIADGNLSALKIGNTWVLEEKDVLDRISRHPRAGRPRASHSKSASIISEDRLKKTMRAKEAKRLFRECKEILSAVPDAAMIVEAKSTEEASFYIAVSDFFLQQKQQELIHQGVF